jgi:uncharacterized membrane protein HdeD (DUF308 family)
MSEPRERPVPPPISMASAAAVVFGVAAILLALVADAFHPIALILGVAALFVGVITVVNSRRRPAGGAWLGYAGAALGLVATAVVVVSLG